MSFDASRSKSETVVELITKIVPITLTGKTPLHQACIRLDIPLIEQLVQFGADINAQDKDKATALHYAVLYQNLFPAGLNVRRPRGYRSKATNTDFFNDYIACRCTRNSDGLFDQDQFAVLHEPGKWSHFNVVVLLVDNGAADVSASDQHGRTPLMIAATLGYVGIVEYLIEKGAIVDQIDYFGKTALNNAVSSEHDDVANILQQRMLNKTSLLPAGKLKFNETDLHIATGRGLLRCVETLLRNGADPNAVDESLYRPLHIAIESRAEKRFMKCSDMIAIA